MADLNWFRQLGQRSKTPDVNREEGPRSPRRIRPAAAVRRVSSLLTLSALDHGSERRHDGSSHSPSPSLASSSLGSIPKVINCDTGTSASSGSSLDQDRSSSQPGSFKAASEFADGLEVPEAERTWHTPNLHQMVETLQVAMMMKKDSLEPIQIRFNSHVLALLEGYNKLRLQLGNEATRIAEVQDLRERELDQFRAISEDWLKREQGYRDEVKRLELQLAEAKSMEAVILARSGSLVDRSATARKRFEERVKRLSGSKVDEEDDIPSKDTDLTRTNTHKNIGSMPRIIDPDQDRLISEQLQPKDRKPRQKKLKLRRPSRGENPLKPDAAPKENAEEQHTTYVSEGAPGPSRRPTRVELPAYYQGGVDSSSSSCSGIDSSPETDDNERTQRAPTIKVSARSRKLPQADYDDTRRFSFAVGQVDTLPTPAGVKSPSSDGAADGQPHGLGFSSEAGSRPDALRKTDSSSSQATVIRDTLWEDPATPVKGPRDSRNSSTGSRASSDERTEQKPRLDLRPFSTRSSTTQEDEQTRITRGDAAAAFPFLPGAAVSSRRMATPARPARLGAADRMPSSSSNVSRTSSSKTTTSSGPTSPVLPSEAGGSTNAARIAAALAVARGQKREPKASEG